MSKTEQNKNRFQGIINLYGETALNKIQASHVTIAGIGGVGSWVAEALARTGIGKLTLIDMDDVCITNTNRQIHTNQKTYGKMKIEAMKERVLSINPDIHVNTVFDFVFAKNINDFLKDKPDFFVDATDHLEAKCAISFHCRQNKIPFMISGGAGGKTDPTKVEISDVNLTTHDNLLRRMRQKLKKEYGYSKTKKKLGVPCVFSPEAPKYSDGSGGICKTKPKTEASQKLDCFTGFGSASFLTGTFGFTITYHIIKTLLK